MFRKGHRFISLCAPLRYVVVVVSTHAISDGEGERIIRASLYLLAGVPVGLLLLVMWSTFVKTSPTVDADERIRGWESVWRELPATLFLLLVCFIGLVLAVVGARRGAVPQASRLIWMYGAALFFVLLVVMNGSAETIMTTRASTVKWVLLPVQVGITALVVCIARRQAAQTLPS